MRNFFLLLGATMFSSALYGQKLGNNVAERENQITTLNTSFSEARMLNRVHEMNTRTPIGINQFADARSSDFEPIYFEVYPNPSSEWLGCDFPANRNIQFVRILNVAGQVVASFHRWDRLFYVGNLESGLYQLQVVQNNFMAHSTTFYKR